MTNVDDFRLILDDMASKQASPEGLARRHAAMLAFGRRVGIVPAIDVLIQDAMALVAEALEAELGGVAEVLPDGQTYSMKIGATDNHGKVINVTTHNGTLAAENSMAAYAMNMACPVVTGNLAAESRFKDYPLRRMGVVSAVCVPLNLGDESYGALGVYSREPRVFADDEIHFVETIGHLLTSTVARARMVAETAREQAFSGAVLDLVESLVITLDLEGKLIGMNEACQRVTGFTIEETRDKPLWQVLIAPEEVDLIRGLLYASSSGIRPCAFESAILTKSGQRRQAAWAVKAIPAHAGGKPLLLMVGTDRTPQVELEAELQKARESANRTTQMMGELHARVNKAADMAMVADPARELAEGKAGVDRAAGGRSGQELRASPRLAYHYYQLIAPLYANNRVPSRKDFFAVECNDISAGGISFLFDRRPDFESLVVALGRPPGETFFTAQIVRVATEEKEGKTRYLVGCRFTGRMSL